MRILCKAGVQPRSLILTCALVNAYIEWHDVDNLHATLGDAPDALVITAGRNGKHMAGSRHYTDDAIDVRSKTFRDKLQFVGAVINRLGVPEPVTTKTGAGFQTTDKKWLGIVEYAGSDNEHFHFEWN